MFKRILVPLDGSNLSELALPYAEKLAGTFNSEVDLVEVCEPGERQHRHMLQLYVEKTAEMMRNHIKEAGLTVKVEPVVLDGKPAKKIIDYAKKSDASLIIMATHGRSGILFWTMGSVANKISHEISMPVLLIRAKAPVLKEDESVIFSKILVPLDGSTTGEVALPHVIELTKKLASDVILFQVITSGQHVHTVGGLDYVRFTEQQVESMKVNAKKYLEGVGKGFAGTRATVRSEVKFGNSAAEIIKFADETAVPLVAMATHGHSGIERWTFGSVTHKILHGGNTHVLLVRARG